jgi:hypothetical protein
VAQGRSVVTFGATVRQQHGRRLYRRAAARMALAHNEAAWRNQFCEKMSPSSPRTTCSSFLATANQSGGPTAASAKDGCRRAFISRTRDTRAHRRVKNRFGHRPPQSAVGWGPAHGKWGAPLALHWFEPPRAGATQSTTSPLPLQQPDLSGQYVRAVSELAQAPAYLWPYMLCRNRFRR